MPNATGPILQPKLLQPSSVLKPMSNPFARVFSIQIYTNVDNVKHPILH